MKTLADLLKDFDGRHLTEAQLTEQFEMIAKAAIYGGHFRVNDEYNIYIAEVEFYFHSEDDTVSIVHDFAMYHRGTVDWFPIGSLHPHRSGIDVTFERQDAYRASFLIRKYAIEDKIINTPSYLPEDLIGYTGCILGDGPKIEWMNTNYDDTPLRRYSRIKVRAYDERGIALNDDNGNKQYDNRPWRFTKA
jgi:hypothetical protein